MILAFERPSYILKFLQRLGSRPTSIFSNSSIADLICRGKQVMEKNEWHKTKGRRNQKKKKWEVADTIRRIAYSTIGIRTKNKRDRG